MGLFFLAALHLMILHSITIPPQRDHALDILSTKVMECMISGTVVCFKNMYCFVAGIINRKHSRAPHAAGLQNAFWTSARCHHVDRKSKLLEQTI